MQAEDKAWIEYLEKFSEVYDESSYSSSLQSSVMRSIHKLVEKAFDDQAHFSGVLEVGAGTGEYLPFVRHSHDEYTPADLGPKTLEVDKRKLADILNGKVTF